MKKNIILWAVLPMMAALVMTACSSNDNNVTEAPIVPSEAKIIPYSVTVNDGATTRATVDDDNKTLRFAEGDMLYITGTNIKGVLEIQTGVGATGATFSGTLTYSGEGSPADNLELTATLVSAQQNSGQVSVDDAGVVTVNYPTDVYCSSVNDAVEQYSRLTGTSTYGAKSFTLNQQTAFLNFVITFKDGTTTDTEFSAVVSNNSSNICTANVTTTTESEKVVAKFVLPVAKGTKLSSAKVKMGDKAAIGFGASQTLSGKVYNVKKMYTTMAAEAVAEDVGKLICQDGHIHAYGEDAACSTARVAKIVYVGSETGEAAPYNHGLALAMSDANGTTPCIWKTSDTDAGHTKQTTYGDFASESGLQYNATHNTNEYPAFKAAIANNGTAAPTGCSAWFLASGYQWEQMGARSSTYAALRYGFESVGGTNMFWGPYWTSTEYDDRYARYGYFGGNMSWSTELKDRDAWIYVRSCLAF